NPSTTVAGDNTLSSSVLGSQPVATTETKTVRQLIWKQVVALMRRYLQCLKSILKCLHHQLPLVSYHYRPTHQ
ncbi:hypothetical protein ACMZ65_09580, partial [Streptococcus pluranimalium]